ncbi:MAG: hypothetical protein IT374_15080 [Polyangiaceae bacterium]|nr:hypothetical protein [Polyangiaceae bacterium]
MIRPLVLAALVALSTAACSKREVPLYGVRLGDAMSTARDHLVTHGEGRWESEAGAVPALTWTASSPSAPLRRARLEFHKGALVAARLVVAPDAPEAAGPALSVTSVQLTSREEEAGGARAVTLLSLDCPEHADEVKALLARAKASRLVQFARRVPASNFRARGRVMAGRTRL